MTPHRHPQDDENGRAERDRRGERKGLLATFFVTVTILVAELVGGILTNSLALLADAGHMLSDALAILLALAALVFATRPATPEKTYGWYRLEILAALINGVTLVVISLMIFWEAYERLLSPPDVRVGLMMGVAVLGLVANGLALHFLSGHPHSLNLRGAYLHVLGDLLSSVGVVVGGAVMWATGSYVIDPVISVIIGMIIIVGAYRLLKESVDVLLEATPVGIDTREVADVLEGVDGVEGIHDLHVWSLTSGVHALSCHVEVKPQRLEETDAILDRIRVTVDQRFGIDHTTIQIESEHYKSRSTVKWRL